MDDREKTIYLNRIKDLSIQEITSAEFFDELFSIDEFERMKKLLEIEKRLSEVGMTKGAFEKLFKARDKEQKKMIKQMQHGFFEGEGRVLQFKDCPQLACGIWYANDSGIFLDTPFGQVCACRHPIYPAELYCNVTTNSYKVKLRYFLRGYWHEIIVDKEQISSATKIVSLSNKGIQVTSENARNLVKFLNEVEALNDGIIEEKQSTSKFGWIHGNFMPYTEGIEFDNEDSLKPLFDSIRQCGNYADWLVEVMEIRKKQRLELQIYFAASLASVLVEPCGSLPFIVSLFGGTGLGKTVALMYASSIWGDPSEGGYISDAKSTPTALEVKLDCLNSMPLMIDDIAQIQNQYDGKFSQLIYQWCSGRGRERSNVRLGLSAPKSWRNCILTNGERSLAAETSQGGAVNRIIEIELTEELFEDGTKTSKIFRNNFGYFGLTFIEKLMQLDNEDHDSWATIVSKEVDEILAQLKQMSKDCGDEKEDKQLIPLAEIIWADRFVEKNFFRDGITIDIKQAFDLLKGKNEISEHRRCYEYINEQLILHHGHIMKDAEAEPDKNIDAWGFYLNDGQKVALLPTTFNKLLKDGGFQSRAFLGWAKARNLIEYDEDKSRSQKQMRWKGKKLRMVVLKVQTEIETDPETGFIRIDDDIADDIPFD